VNERVVLQVLDPFNLAIPAEYVSQRTLVKHATVLSDEQNPDGGHLLGVHFRFRIRPVDDRLAPKNRAPGQPAFGLRGGRAGLVVQEAEAPVQQGVFKVLVRYDAHKAVSVPANFLANFNF